MCNWVSQSLRTLVLPVFASLFLSIAATARAEQAVLQGVQVTEKEDAIVLQIDFSVPLQYMRHFPPNAGEILQVQLQPLEIERPKEKEADTAQPAGEAEQSLAKPAVKRESMLPPATDLVPLVNITYEGEVPGGPFLTLRFKYPVEYKLAAGAGSKSLIVSVKKDAGGLTVRGSVEGEQALLSDEKLDELIVEARQSLAREEFGRAIQLLSRLLQLPAHKHSQEAKELMGVAREKKGQIARAKLEYQEYLRLYPEGEGAERVKQRLAAIELAQVEPREKLKEVREKPAAISDTFGRFSQRYYKDSTSFKSSGEFEGRTDARATLTSFLNLSSRYRTEEYDARGFFNAHDLRTLQGEGDDDPELNTAYVDIKNRTKKYSASVGRQSSNRGGVFGRFDGAMVGYEYKPRVEIAATAGKPVPFSSADIDADRLFYGASAAMGTFKEHYDANAYYIEQRAEGIIDRRAVGGDIRYTDKLSSMFASFDYDVSYGVLNILFLRGGWKISQQARVDVNYNVRQTPLILTTNALQQEGTNSFRELLNMAGESAIREKVPKISSLSRMLTIGAVYDLDPNNQVNADVTVSSVDARDAVPLLKCTEETPCDPGSEVIPKNEAYGPEYSYSVQFIASNHLVERDIHIIGGRLTSGDDRSSTSLFLRSRFPYGEQWYIGPRVQVDRSQNDLDNSKLTHPSLAVKVDYRWKKNVSFEAELGYELNNYSGGNTPDYTRTTLFVGYNVDF